MEIKSILNKLESTQQIHEENTESPITEELIHDSSEAKERDENGPWALWSNLKASSTKSFCASPTPTENELLTDILIKYGNNPEGIPAIHYAILKNDTQAVDLLLKHGASPSTKDSRHLNCLYYSIQAKSLDFVKKFIDLGVNPNEQSDMPPLYLALMSHQNDIAKYLINRGVAISGEMGLDYIDICARNGNLEIYKLLSNLGVTCKDHNNFVSSLFNFSISNYDCFGLFDEMIGKKIEQGKMEMIKHVFLGKKIETEKDVILRSISSTCPEALIFLLNNKIIGPNDKLSLHNSQNDPILHLAIRNEKYYIELVEILLKRGANANAKGFSGKNALFEVYGMYCKKREDFEKQKEIIKLLISRGADINAINDYKESLLASIGPSPMYDFLVSLGAKRIVL